MNKDKLKKMISEMLKQLPGDAEYLVEHFSDCIEIKFFCSEE